MTSSLRSEDEVKARSLGATDYLIKPATVDEIEATALYLRGRLSPSKSKGQNNGTGSSAHMSLCPLMNVGDGRLQSPGDPGFIMDALNETWNKRN